MKGLVEVLLVSVGLHNPDCKANREQDLDSGYLSQKLYHQLDDYCNGRHILQGMALHPKLKYLKACKESLNVLRDYSYSK